MNIKRSEEQDDKEKESNPVYSATNSDLADWFFELKKEEKEDALT